MVRLMRVSLAMMMIMVMLSLMEAIVEGMASRMETRSEDEVGMGRKDDNHECGNGGVKGVDVGRVEVGGSW